MLSIHVYDIRIKETLHTVSFVLFVCSCMSVIFQNEHKFIYTTQNLIRIKLLFSFAEGPAYLIPNIL